MSCRLKRKRHGRLRNQREEQSHVCAAQQMAKRSMQLNFGSLSYAFFVFLFYANNCFNSLNVEGGALSAASDLCYTQRSNTHHKRLEGTWSASAAGWRPHTTKRLPLDLGSWYSFRYSFKCAKKKKKKNKSNKKRNSCEEKAEKRRKMRGQWKLTGAWRMGPWGDAADGDQLQQQQQQQREVKQQPAGHESLMHSSSHLTAHFVFFFSFLCRRQRRRRRRRRR